MRTNKVGYFRLKILLDNKKIIWQKRSIIKRKGHLETQMFWRNVSSLELG